MADDPNAPTHVPTVGNGPASDASTRAESWPSSSGATSERDVGSSLMRYRLDAVLGRGGMGEVLSARDQQIGRSVAIKRMRSADPSPDTVARFLREARIQGRLEHPAVVPVHELWRDDHGQPFFVMKQLHGTTLADVLATLDATRYPRRRLLRAFVDVCLAIEFAHTRGIVHRDLKPANIMLGDFGEVYVLDWGVARVMGDDPERESFADIETLDHGATVAGSILGTPGYMSPEQIRGDLDLDGRADVYALGSILFELLTLHPLHERGLAGLTSALAGIEARPSVRFAASDVPPELEAICVRATAIDRADRFPSARELGDAVQRFLDGDRDLVLRKELATAELDQARAAFARGTTASDRRAAMQAAGRALALDPTAREPAELVGRLMLEPPAEALPEVEDELDAADLAELRGVGKLAAGAMFGYLAFLPILFYVGFREPWYLVTALVLLASNVWAGVMIATRRRWIYCHCSIAVNVLLLALFSRILTPFLVAPGLGVITIMAIATHPKLIRAWLLWLVLSAAILIPWLLEAIGVLSATTWVVGRGLVLHTAAGELAPTATMIGLVLYVMAIMAVAATLSRGVANNQRDTRRVLQTQAWQLRQLVAGS